MSYRIICNWPPVWTCGYGIERKTATGEIGILKHVILNERMPHTCFMIVDYAGECYVGSLLFDDTAFASRYTTCYRVSAGSPSQILVI